MEDLLMQAIVLAGGLGTRLRSVISDIPKPMATVHGRPFLAFVLDRLVDCGFTDVVFATGYRHEVLHGHFGNGYRGLNIAYSVETEPLGTGGAIRLALDHVGPQNVFVMNGDTYLELDFHAMLATHDNARPVVTVAVCRVPNAARYGTIELHGDIAQRFIEKGPSGPGWINAGTYILCPCIRRFFPSAKAFSFERDVLARDIATIRPLVFRSYGQFIDIGTPDDYARAEYMLPR
jgi:D-glycero-alpha-D-manno-heptose 1-phosphate guanylyltransferase